MFRIKVNDNQEYQVSFDRKKKVQTLGGKPFEWDLAELKKGSFHILKDHRSWNAEVIETDYQQKKITIKINTNTYTLTVKDRFDDLLHDLGMDKAGGGGVTDIKAPMPGMVLDVRVAEGTDVKKGDAVVVLEAMKMENIIKSTGDGTVKKIHVKKGVAVEKNQVMVSFYT